MIVEPLNDHECLGQLTVIATEGAANAEIRKLASRFPDTGALAAWIRGLPQRDDTGQADDGPRVLCDVGQRARLVADDPNCVERAILYLSAAEAVDPGPVRQLATVDVSATTRHTFPIEDGEPVVLDPELRRNALRAQVWRLRNGGDGGHATEPDAIDAAALLTWLLDLAEDAADQAVGTQGVRRIERARRALAALLAGGRIHPRDRAHVLYALRLAGDVAPWFGETGREGYRLARVLVARVVTDRTVGARGQRNVSAERAVFWGGKAVAIYYGVGGLYDSAYAEVRRRPAKRAREPPKGRREPGRPAQAPSALAAAVVRQPAPPSGERTDAAPAQVLGTLGELQGKKGP